MEALEQVKARFARVIPIVSECTAATDTRFGCAHELMREMARICDHRVISTIAGAEPIGPQKLLDLLKQDIAEASPQELIGIPCGQMELYATSYADMDEHIAPESYAEVGRYIFPTFKRTLVFLKEKGYAFVMEKENLKQYDYSVTYNAEEMDVTDPEQKEELAQSLIREWECPAWLETEAGVSVKVALNSTESAGESLNGIEFAVLKAKEPEFIKKIVETGEEEE